MSSEICADKRQEMQTLKSLQSRCREYKKVSKVDALDRDLPPSDRRRPGTGRIL